MDRVELREFGVNQITNDCINVYTLIGPNVIHFDI